MSNENTSKSKLDKWREKYSVLTIALLCLYNVSLNWGDNWLFTGFFGLGVLLLGTIAVFDIKRANNERK